jgi:hypothetical protein
MKSERITGSMSLPGMALCLTIGLCLLSGCRSRYVQATIENHTDTPLKLIEVDYPSASFGTGQLAAHAAFHYRFKVQGSGVVKMSFTDGAGQMKNATGPELTEGEEGALGITIESGDQVRWATDLAAKK